MSNKLKDFLNKLDGNTPEMPPVAMAAYMAGMVDADGSVSMQKDGNYRRPIVTVYNNDYSIMEKLQMAFGGKISTRRFDNPRWADSYEIRFNTNESLYILEAILPYMQHNKKKARAQLLVENYVKFTPRNGKYTKQQLEQKRWLEKEVMSIQMRGVDATLY